MGILWYAMNCSAPQFDSILRWDSPRNGPAGGQRPDQCIGNAAFSSPWCFSASVHSLQFPGQCRNFA